MNQYKKIISGLLLLTAMLQPMAGASNVDIPAENTQNETSEVQIVPFADVIVRKYRLYNGKRQYRRWNDTRGYWVDKYWIDIPK